MQIVHFYETNPGRVVYTAHNRGLVARLQVRNDRRLGCKLLWKTQGGTWKKVWNALRNGDSPRAEGLRRRLRRLAVWLQAKIPLFREKIRDAVLTRGGKNFVSRRLQTIAQQWNTRRPGKSERERLRKVWAIKWVAPELFAPPFLHVSSFT
jgi:hypothetical protein